MDQLKNNLEFASSMGRVWEHQFCSARVTINFLLKTHDGNLTDESLQTLLVAVEAVVNLHPLKLEAINDRKKSNFTWSNKPFHNKMEDFNVTTTCLSIFRYILPKKLKERTTYL